MYLSFSFNSNGEPLSPLKSDTLITGYFDIENDLVLVAHSPHYWSIDNDVISFDQSAFELFVKINNLNAIFDLVSLQLDNKAKEETYFYGLGFVNGMDSVSRYPTNADAKILSKWAMRVWQTLKLAKTEVLASNKTVDDIVLTRLEEVVNYLLTNTTTPAQAVLLVFNTDTLI